MKPLSPFAKGLRLRPIQPTFVQSVKAEKPTMTFSPPAQPAGIDTAIIFAIVAFSLAIVKHLRR